MKRLVLPLLAVAVTSAAAPASAQSGNIRDILGSLVGGQTGTGLPVDQILNAIRGRSAVRPTLQAQQQPYAYSGYNGQRSYDHPPVYRHQQHNRHGYGDPYRSEYRAYSHHHEEHRDRDDEGDDD